MNIQTPGINRHAHRLAGVCLAFAALSIAAPAQAEWHVRDQQARERLRSIDNRIGSGDVNARLRQIYEQQQLAGGYSSSDENAKAPDEPEEKLTDDQPSQFVTMDEAKRCPTPRGSGVVQDQWQLCREIYRTEMAQYNYSLKMYELTRKRQQYLDQLKSQRANIGATETGKLHDNTNRVLLLMSQMEIDRQQQKTYMDAYAARLHYLQQATKTMSQQALDGTKGANGGIGSIIGGLVGGLALDAALDAAQSRRRF